MNAARPQAKRPTAGKKPPAGPVSRGDADLEQFRDIADDVIESDFVPFACLFDERSIATKNGELLQIIKITGLGFDAQGSADLRSAIRQAIAQCIPDTSYAIWLHTLRRRQQLMATAHFPDKFSGQLDTQWRELHPASASFVNELYITIVKAGQAASLKHVETFLQSLRPRRDRSARNQYLDASLEELSATTERVLAQLKPFGARLLSVVERNNLFYSEQLEFLEKLINLEERPMPVPMRDLSQVLTSGDITFGHNSMEVRTAEGKRRFATILSVKEYKESSLAGIDKFLDIPCEMIVSQCFDFIGAETARETYETQARYLSISGDKELAQWMEIDRLTQSLNSNTRSFGEQQTSIFLIAPGMKQLEANVKLTQKAMAKLGMVAVREDLLFENCYWAQLPGNFPFIARKRSTDTQHLAGFATVQTQPMGNAAGSPWGPPVSLLTTVQDAPYFFNFHRDASAHTVILGAPKSGRTSMAHFLIAQARKLGITIWYLDVHGRSKALMEAMGGKCLTPGTAQLRLNPFALPDTPANREFLAIWLATLIDPYGRQLNRASLGFFQSLIGELMQLPQPQRRLSALLPIVRAHDAMLAATLSRWVAGGEFGELFDMADDQFRPEKLISWNLAPWFNNDATRGPLASYLLHRLTMELKKDEPTLFVLDEAFDLLNTPLFGPRAAAWCDFLSANNAAAMLMTDRVEYSASMSFTASVASRAASIFAMPERAPGAEYIMGFGLSETDIAAIAHMDPLKRHVLLKRGDSSSMLRMDLSSIGPSLPVLSGRATPAPTSQSPADLLAALMGQRQASA